MGVILKEPFRLTSGVQNYLKFLNLAVNINIPIKLKTLDLFGSLFQTTVIFKVSRCNNGKYAENPFMKQMNLSITYLRHWCITVLLLVFVVLDINTHVAVQFSLPSGYGFIMLIKAYLNMIQISEDQFCLTVNSKGWELGKVSQA